MMLRDPRMWTVLGAVVTLLVIPPLVAANPNTTVGQPAAEYVGASVLDQATATGRDDEVCGGPCRRGIIEEPGCQGPCPSSNESRVEERGRSPRDTRGGVNRQAARQTAEQACGGPCRRGDLQEEACNGPCRRNNRLGGPADG